MGDLGDAAGLATELSGDRVEVGLRDGRQVGCVPSPARPGGVGGAGGLPHRPYQGSGTSGAATSGTGSTVPVDGSASSTV